MKEYDWRDSILRNSEKKLSPSSEIIIDNGISFFNGTIFPTGYYASEIIPTLDESQKNGEDNNRKAR